MANLKKTNKAWERCDEKILLGYHNAGFSLEQVTCFMLKKDADYKPTKKEIKRVETKAFRMGVKLRMENHDK